MASVNVARNPSSTVNDGLHPVEVIIRSIDKTKRS